MDGANPTTASELRLCMLDCLAQVRHIIPKFASEQSGTSCRTNFARESDKTRPKLCDLSLQCLAMLHRDATWGYLTASARLALNSFTAESASV